MSQKKQAATTNQAKVDTAEETKKGETGAKERLRDQRKSIAKFEAEAVVFENERSQERETSDAQLEKGEIFSPCCIKYCLSSNNSQPLS